MDKKVESPRQSHKEWRRIAKRERRRRIRRKTAQKRDFDEESLRAKLESTAEYSNWISQRAKEQEEREIAEKREHDEREKLWLEEEVRAQKEWQIQLARRAKQRQEQLLQEEIIRKEFEAKQEALRTKKEETKRRHEEDLKKHLDIQQEIDNYIDKGAETPEILRVVSETQSSKEPCPFFTKTGACRYGDICSRNHRRVSLSKVIMVPGFYSHFSLEKNSAEYDTDVSLEFESSETRQHFREFYESVLPELESFGRIKTLKYCRNTEIHLRGNLYIEYYTEREAARAWRKLKGRYYAQRQLNCEFVNLTSWRNAVCGMGKCPKGRACNFLHTFRNPNDEYDIKSPPRWAKRSESIENSCGRRSKHRSKSKWDDWDRASPDESRNWRWSESPEQEGETREKNERSRQGREERSDRRHDCRSDRKRTISSSRSRKRDYDSQKRETSSRRSRRTEDPNDRDKDSLRKRAKKSRTRHKRSSSDEEITQRYSDGEKLGKSKRRDEKKISRQKSRRESKTERKCHDENYDANSNDSRTIVSKEIDKVQFRENPNNGTIDEKKNSPTLRVVGIPISPSENEWTTTDSE